MKTVMIDDGSIDKFMDLQFFVKLISDHPDAITMLDDSYSADTRESLAWAVGQKRLLLKSTSSFEKQMKLYKDAFYTIMSDLGDFTFTNNGKQRREFYMYYSNDRKKNHDMDFCDNGYNCIELPFDPEDLENLLSEMAVLFGVICTFKRPAGTLAMCSGGEFKIDRRRNLIKMKLMPQINLNEHWLNEICPIANVLNKYIKDR